MSLAEDLGVGGVVAFAMFHPQAAAVVAAVLLAGGLLTLAFLASRIRRFLRRRAQAPGGRRLASRRL